MTRNFISTVLAASVTLTSISAVPAKADDEDIAKVLIGLALIAGIAHALDKDEPVPAPIPPAPVPVTPVTFSTGPLNIPQTWTADLDHGGVGGAGVDLWFEADTATALFVTPRNGARIAVGDRSNRGFSGCSVASYTSARIALSAIPVGSYICAKTNEGRVSQFRVNEITAGSPKTLRLGYTTWQ